MSAPTYTRETGRTGQPVVQCDRCGIRMGIRATASHTEAHTVRDSAIAGYRVPDGERATDHHHPIVRRHLRWIVAAEQGRTV